MTYTESSVKEDVKKAKNHEGNLKDLDSWRAAAVKVLINRKERHNHHREIEKKYSDKISSNVDYDNVSVFGREHEGKTKEILNILASKKGPKYRLTSRYITKALKNSGFDVKYSNVSNFLGSLNEHSENFVREQIPTKIMKRFRYGKGGSHYLYEYKSDSELNKEKDRKKQLRMKMCDEVGRKI